MKVVHVLTTNPKPRTKGAALTLFDRIQYIRIGGAVERCHTVRHFGSYSNAAHSWGVAALLYLLWPDDFPRLVAHCIFHDVPEGWVGDPPATIKKDEVLKPAYDGLERKVFDWLKLPCEQDFSDEDKDKLKACDHLELYLWSIDQSHAGNAHVICVRRALDEFFKERPLPKPADELLKQIRLGAVTTYTISETRNVHDLRA